MVTIATQDCHPIDKSLMGATNNGVGLKESFCRHVVVVNVYVLVAICGRQNTLVIFCIQD